jgi:hypothetical protein
MDRRIEGLLQTAVRSRQVARGADAVTGAGQRGEADLVVVARDAAAAAELTEVRSAVSEGRAIAWGDKLRLGRLFARPGDPEGAGVGVLSVASRPLAEGLRQAAQIAGACTGQVQDSTARAPRRRQVAPAGSGGARGTDIRGARRGQAPKGAKGPHGRRGHEDDRSDG